MAVIRFPGVHVLKEGRPAVFRTAGGLLPIGTGIKGAAIEPRFSRKSETANLDEVKMQHSRAAATFDVAKNKSIHVTNNTPHIARLNEGWSAQAEAGFFERAIMIAKDAIRGTWRLETD